MTPEPVFQLSGNVTEGEKVGRTIGFPTANLDVSITSDQLEPGVYLATCTIGDSIKPRIGLAYFGPRYVMGESKLTFEIYLYDFSEEIYGQTLTVTLLEKTRDPRKMTSLKELKTTLQQDKENGLKLFQEKYPQYLTD